MKIIVSTRPAITDGTGLITEDVFANNIFLGRLVFRPEGYGFDGWAAYVYSDTQDAVARRIEPTQQARDFVLNVLSAYAAEAIVNAQAEGREVIEPSDGEFYGEGHQDVLRAL